MPDDEIVVLANSTKLNGRCVAGISTKSGKWVRPVSDLPGGELKPRHYEIEDREPAILDVVRLGVKRRLKDAAQPENILLNDAQWQRVERLAPADAYAWLEPHISTDPLLFGDSERSIDDDAAERGVGASLVLVEPDGELEFTVGEFKGQPKVRVRFELAAVSYDLPLTDSAAEPKVASGGLGTHRPGDVGLPTDGHALLTVSLGESFKEQHWKLVAALVFVP